MALSRIVRALAGVLFLVSTGAAHNAKAQNWDGSGLLRFGVFLQGQFVDLDIRQTPLGAPAFSQSASPNGFGVGIAAGYDLRLGQFVIGAELDASFDNGTDKPSPAQAEQYGVDYFATVRGRLGYIVHPNLMLYGTVGYGMLGAEYKLGGFAGGGGGGGFKRNATLDGVVYGGGAEWDMGWGIAFLEYLHTDLDGWTFRALTGNPIAVEASDDVVRLGLKFKVGHDYAHDVYKKYEPLK